MKRIFDIVVAALLLILALPLLIMVAISVRVALGSPILLAQRRPGWRGRPFTFLKFRTMTQSTDARGQLLPDEARLTKFGRCLRATSLDELPQLINVIRGDMSLVGPRPLLMEYLPLYTAEQARRHEVRPGITGWAQIHGRNAISWEEKFVLDVWYVDHHSFLLDLRILAMTVGRVLMGSDISKKGYATTEKFRGLAGD